MSLAKDVEISAEIPENIIIPPSDLWSDEPPLESDIHRLQMQLLIDCLMMLWRNRNDFYVSGNLTIYYSPKQIKSRDFRGPDFFVVLDSDRTPRKSWVVWDEEGKYPNFILEIISNTTAQIDKGLKKEIYQDIFRTPEYFWFDPDSLELAGFVINGGKYQAISPNDQGWLWSQQLELYLGIHEQKLRFFTRDNQLVLSPAEIADLEQKRADLAQKQADLAQQRAEILSAQLRELGIEPNA